MPEEVTDTEQTPLTQEQQTQLLLKQRIQHNFSYHSPGGNQPAVYAHLRSEAMSLALEIAKYVPNSREQSIAITKLEEVVMWANAGIARNGLAHDGSDL